MLDFTFSVGEKRPQERRPFQCIPGHAYEIYYSDPDVSISSVTFGF